MAPRKKTKRKANKRVKVTHPPVPDAGEFSQAYDQNQERTDPHSPSMDLFCCGLMTQRRSRHSLSSSTATLDHDTTPQPVSQRTRGKRNRPVIPDSDDELATEDETEDGSPVPSQTHINPGLNDVRRWIAYYVVQYYVVASRNKKLIHDATTQ